MNKKAKLINLAKKYIEQLKGEGITDTIMHKKKKAKIAVRCERASEKFGSLEKITDAVNKCRKCPLGSKRKNAVPGEGNPKTRLMFVGEGPGHDEDRLGRPFIGRAGKLLDKIIESMGLKREEVFIANMVKCHPMIDPSDPDKRGNDRKPSTDEIQACLPYLEEQIEIINPEIICSLGSVSATTLTGIEMPMGKLRGKFYDFACGSKTIKLMPTFHPAALLRNPAWKKETWEDIQMIMKELKLKPRTVK